MVQRLSNHYLFAVPAVGIHRPHSTIPQSSGLPFTSAPVASWCELFTSARASHEAPRPRPRPRPGRAVAQFTIAAASRRPAWLGVNAPEPATRVAMQCSGPAARAASRRRPPRELPKIVPIFAAEKLQACTPRGSGGGDVRHET